MKMLKIVFFISLFVGFGQLNAQNQSPKNTNVPNENANSPVAEKAYVTPPINENDQYMGRAEEFLHIMIVDKLPSDFPVYDKTMGLRLYNDKVENYFIQHLDLLKDKWKQKLLNGQTNNKH